ncbi:hypothetical protein [Paenibacillus thalictri]|uniref:Uncharacterized protein n=1 Tax=Paenibacillus thalictri TaxID=2527873 RepID=A0A4Q9DW53_9BACL|nr:hypothetical protein [Paenibacillus thalictri]TBL81297.1 hypothetical protein EYB31_04215 [Paenibacillus thalictri]
MPRARTLVGLASASLGIGPPVLYYGAMMRGAACVPRVRTFVGLAIASLGIGPPVLYYEQRSAFNN